ncbi:thioredoxin-dependent thiol peroxidase [Caminibacter mediatlanticus]|uniref:Putative peroxiredoxin bcp n=1 Tax=Caminibacter mediatlanticus TB-2 TaxID=391592 RepID=A0AAI9AG19_9BACT|nr:thioredoxin-dependent thiol peroxidase [Caminibacter mediatlanticus]EDM23501.1 Alkyl hydroperoxide reductase/ Thiol specific antioxidant/ Mal allergen [Caminibacter mediatlanticus TB-2]
MTKASDFCLPNQDGVEICLRDLKGKWVILYFYPKDNTPGCTTEAKEFSELIDEFEKLGAVVIGVSPDSPKKHCNFIEKHGLKITLLSDEEKKVLKEYGAWGKKKNYGREYEGVIRSTFIIDPEGNIVKEFRNVRAKDHATKVLEELKKLINS